MMPVKHYFYLSLFSCFAFGAKAQYAGDAFRYSESAQTGTARFQGVGGNHAALGGDASNIFGNPAGLGFYNRSELSISPAVTSFNTKTNYIGTESVDSKANFNIGQASLILTSQPSFQRKWKRSTFGVSFSRQQAFTNRFTYAGVNDRSAYLDQVVEDANAQQYSINEITSDFDAGSNGSVPLAYSVPAAYYQLYLINPTSSQTNVPNTWTALDAESAVDQLGTFESKGATTQWSFAYAGNYDDKLYVGGNLGISSIRYDYRFYHDDLYLNSPDIISNTKVDSLTVRGTGVNLTLGMMYRVTPSFQLGGQLSTPTFTGVNETFYQYFGATFVDGVVPDGNGNLISPSYDFVDMAPNDFKYQLTGPFKGAVGATYLINRSGFITGTIEYIGYNGMGANTKDLSAERNSAFKTNTKNEIANTYRNTVNVRVGGEFRTGVFRARAGMAYLADPYLSRNDGVNRDRWLASFGAGVRNNKYFLDISATFSPYKTAFTPYVLNNAQDYYSAEIKNTSLNVQLSAGVFFGQ
ncbi:hypothetical protein CLV98_11071 [Dyadobacter jejuensis]|uniref:Long-subunit fatty acid transport protein n=1 Tax=Dyadobacter jejuensis TaxID=1082580 RepID=A0A316AIQ8_9BACT|nr:hypothetical protein [Dyadobacter jejuensis]PWJ56760.1 hypothetical protein CLV98_11071 [Dyadobacter jejuensis]